MVRLVSALIESICATLPAVIISMPGLFGDSLPTAWHFTLSVRGLGDCIDGLVDQGER